jgi:hypothetical protein
MNRFRCSGLALSGLLVAGLLSLPAGAAGGGFGLSIKVHGAFSYLQASDVNAGAGGLIDFYKSMYESYGYATVGEYQPFHRSYGFGADFIFSISPRLGVGLGVGYLQGSGKSRLDIDAGTQIGRLLEKPRLCAMPIRLGLFASWPIGKKLSLIANVGAAYYANVKFHNIWRIEEETTGNWMEHSIVAKMNRFGNVGFQGGLGIEYALAPRVLVFFEALGRYARFNNFPSATYNYDYYDGYHDDWSGKIYIVTQTTPDWTYTRIYILETEPVPDEDTTYYEPRFDFSGFALQVGFRVKL